MMNPGGTGSPRLVISARFAPLPPSRSFMSLLPSAKSYTNFSSATVGLPCVVPREPYVTGVTVRTPGSPVGAEEGGAVARAPCSPSPHRGQLPHRTLRRGYRQGYRHPPLPP